MDIIKWQTIIIEWINCLKLSKTILNIDDLKDGQCFKEIITRLSINTPEQQTQITEFLKRHYPAFVLDNESTQIQDAIEITYAYSLLLHYCSLVNCSEEFILPLCKDLNYMSQIFVKNFLEDLQASPVITRDILKNAIYKLNKYASTPTKSIASSSFSTPKTPINTSLMEYLKTPHKKQTEEKHKKEVKKLQDQLDFERFEKADLQEELSIQYEKNKKLDKNISENQTEIRRLRAKLLVLENSTPPSNSKQDRNVENKRLRDEIVSLEKYVEILHKEQEELQNERDKARDKLRKMEENANDWQTKCIHNEKQLQKLNEENQNSLKELFYLRERCEELTTMLQELNPKKCYDESYETDAAFSFDGLHNKSGSIDSASLAQTVIDVQLVDAQTENNRLKTQLAELEQTTEKITIQLNSIESEMTLLQQTNKETEKILAVKNEETQKLNEKITALESTLNSTKKEKDNLIDELKQTTEMNKTFIEKLNSEIQNLNTISEQYEVTNQMLTNKFEQFNCDVEKCLQKFKRDLSYEETFPEDCDTIYKLTVLIDAFETKHTNNNKMITNLQDQHEALQKQISKLEKEISTLNTNETERKEQIDVLKSSLKTAENKIEHYEKEVVTNYENLIEKYKSIIEEKCGMISELTKLKDVLINKENTIVKLEVENKEVEKQKQTLEKNCSSLKSIITEKENFIKSLEIEKTQLEKNYNYVNETLLQETTNIKNLNIKLDELNTSKTETESKLQEMESIKTKFETLYNQTKQTLNEKSIYINDLNTQKHELENQIDGLNNQIKSLEDDLSQEKSIKDELNNDLKQIKQQLQNEKTLKDELNNQFINSKQNFETETSELCATIKQKSEEIVSLQNQIKTLNENIETINSEVINITGMLTTEKSNIANQEKTIKNLEKHLSNIKQQLSLNLEEKKEAIDELKNYKQKIESYKNEFETYKYELEQIFDEINLQIDFKQNAQFGENDEILEILQESLNFKQNDNKIILGNMLEKMLKLKENIYNIVYENHRVTSEMNTLQQQYNILNNLKQEIEDKLIRTNEESNNKIQDLNNQIQNLEEENAQYITNLETYRENLNKAHETFAETQISVEGLIKKHKLESDNFKETIADLRKKNTKLEDQIQDLKLNEKSLTEDLSHYQDKLKNVLEDYNTSVRLNEDIKHKKETLSKKLLKQTESFEELQSSLSKTNMELEASLRDIEMFKTIKNEFEKSFNALNKDHESVVSTYETKIKKLKQENDDLKAESEDLVKEMTKTKEKLNVEKLKQNEFDARMKNFTFETDKLEEKIISLKDKLVVTEIERQSLLALQEQLKETTNEMIQETKLIHEEEIKRLNEEIEALKMIQDQSETKKVELLETNISLQKKIEDLNDDKIVLTLKVEQFNDDLIKLKTCSDETYKEKLDEINDTKTKLSYTLNLIENIYHLLENELDKTTIELNESDDTEIPEKLQTRIEQLIQQKKQLQNKISEIEEQAAEDKQNLEEKYTKQINEIKKENQQIITDLEARLKQEQTTSKIYLKEVESLNTRLIDKINELEKLSLDKDNLIKEYKIIANNLALLKQNRSELAEDHQKIIKEVEAYIMQTHEAVNHIKHDFTKRLEEQKKERETNETLIKQLENHLQVEKNNVKFLEERIENLSTDKEKLLAFTTKCFTNIHEFYNKMFENNDVTEQINKLKFNQTEILDELQSVCYEGEIVDKEIDLINNEINELKRIRGEMQNYELVKSDYVTLKNKYNLMSVCETENNGYKLKISDLENKLSDLQNENVKYQKEITELQKELSSVKNEYSKEITLIEGKYATWKKIAEDKNLEIETLINKYTREMKEISESNIDLRKTIKELEDKLYLHEELVHQEKCKNEDLHASNTRLEKELDKQTQEKEKLLTEGKLDYDQMSQKYELLTNQQVPKLEEEIQSLQEIIAKYKKVITDLEQENLNLNNNQLELKQQYTVLLEQCEQLDKSDKKELMEMRASFTTLKGENTRLQLDCTVLKKTIEERNMQLSELQCIKESYEKLLEDNNKAHMELDTLRYKRNRDKEEFKRLLEEERTKCTSNSGTKITDIRNEYEEKLKKMKEKMVNLYKEEMEREKQRITSKLSQSEEIVQSLKSQLWVTGNKNVDLTKEVERLRDQLRTMKEKLQNMSEDFRGSRESMSSLRSLNDRRAVCDVEERRISTLPRDVRSYQRPNQVNIIEETVTVSRKRRSLSLDQGLKMEDEEGELFNNTYLSDLKAGRCIESGRESVSSRLSELQYRNSLCPPHLKSSYPAETQFQSPSQFKEEDLKMGTVDLDDSMSSSLLPGEKPRMKKDWGQTMYKKPGPPTPSKNGGRLSLQGNEIHPRDVLREQNENRPSGRTTSTPSRIKMLFTRSGASSSHRNDSEVGMKSHSQSPRLYEHSLVPLLTRPEPVRLNPQFLKVYHIPHTFGQALRIYMNTDFIRAFLLMIASAFITYILIFICEQS